MASLFASTCWPTRFFAKWLAVFFGAALLGMVLGAVAHKPPPLKPLRPKPAPPLKNIQVYLEAVEVYSDDTRALVPALVSTGGIGEHAEAESDQGKLSIDRKKLTPISRLPGTRLWLIFQWQGHVEKRLINPWPKSTIPYIVEFHLHRPNPHTAIHGAAH